MKTKVSLTTLTKHRCTSTYTGLTIPRTHDHIRSKSIFSNTLAHGQKKEKSIPMIFSSVHSLPPFHSTSIWTTLLWISVLCLSGVIGCDDEAATQNNQIKDMRTPSLINQTELVATAFQCMLQHSSVCQGRERAP